MKKVANLSQTQKTAVVVWGPVTLIGLIYGTAYLTCSLIAQSERSEVTRSFEECRQRVQAEAQKNMEEYKKTGVYTEVLPCQIIHKKIQAGVLGLPYYGYYD